MPTFDLATGEAVLQPSKLVEAVCAVMDQIGYIRGTGKNQEHGYGYTSDADLLRVYNRRAR